MVVKVGKPLMLEEKVPESGKLDATVADLQVDYYFDYKTMIFSIQSYGEQLVGEFKFAVSLRVHQKLLLILPKTILSFLQKYPKKLKLSGDYSRL